MGAEISNMHNEATNLGAETEPNLEINQRISVSGAKLNKLTQATAYKIIRSLRMKKYIRRRQTEENTARALRDTKLMLNINLDEKDLWHGIRHPD